MNSGIYKITNKNNGKIYIGQSIDLKRRKQEYKRSGGSRGFNSVIKKAILKHSWDNFDFEILVYAEGKDYLNLLECNMIKHYNSLLPNGYNARPGGNDSFFTEETRKKMSEKKKDYSKNYEAMQKLRVARANQIITKETYNKISKTISTLVWMNDGIKSYRIRPELIDKRLSEGLVYGRLKNFVTDEFRQKNRNITTKQWQKVKSTGHTGNLIKV
jgi:group I intron endonuclease